MDINVRIRNGLAPDSGVGGASEGDLRGNHTDIIDSLSGVVDKVVGGHLLVHEAGTPAMTVVVDKGVVYIPNDSFDENDSDSVKFWEAVLAGTTGSRTLVIGSNSSGSTRIDIVVATIDPGATPDETASDVAIVQVVAGTPGAGVPATPAYSVKIAEVTVLNGATEITDAKISDSRTQVKIKTEFLGKRVTVVADATSITANSDTTDIVWQKNTQSGGTLTLNAPTGTPIDAQVLIYRIKSTNAQTYAFNGVFRGGAYLPLPDGHAGGGATEYLAFLRNDEDTKWDFVTRL